MPTASRRTIRAACTLAALFVAGVAGPQPVRAAAGDNPPPALLAKIQIAMQSAAVGRSASQSTRVRAARIATPRSRARIR